jgi:hypothetical protein
MSLSRRARSSTERRIWSAFPRVFGAFSSPASHSSFFPAAIYGIVDVATRKNISGPNKAGFIIGLIVLGPIGTVIYFSWALRHQPDATAIPPPPSLSPTTQSGNRALAADDLDYLQKLSDLHSQGVLTDEQYEE